MVVYDLIAVLAIVAAADLSDCFLSLIAAADNCR